MRKQLPRVAVRRFCISASFAVLCESAHSREAILSVAIEQRAGFRTDRQASSSSDVAPRNGQRGLADWRTRAAKQRME